jgi:microcystin-dependent protein
VSTPYIGEIKLVSFNFAPAGWADCNGQLLPILQNAQLFSLFGTTYGGDGVTTFALPNLQGRVPIHLGAGHGLGEAGGTETVTLTASQMPTHSHTLNAATTEQTTNVPTSALLTEGGNYSTSSATVLMDAAAIGTAGGGQAHPNMQPYLTVRYIIALTGTYPPRV